MKFHMSSLRSSTMFLGWALFAGPLEEDAICLPERTYGLPSSMTYLREVKDKNVPLDET